MMPMLRRARPNPCSPWHAFVACSFLLAWSGTAAAENRAAAEVLFDAGRKAMAEGNYDVACSKFLESNRLDPAPGTLLNLGKCEEKRGNLATSWQHYTEAINLLESDDPRHEFAQKKAASLEPRVPRLTLRWDKNAPEVARVMRNGHDASRDLGLPVRLDPGTHRIVVKAEGFRTKTYDVELEEEAHEVLTIRPGPALVESPPPDEPSPRPITPGHDGKTTAGYWFGGVGIVAGLAGATFGVLTFRKYQIVKEHCDLDRDVCFDSVGQDAAETGARYETLAYVLGAAGVASMSVGAYLLLSDEEAEPTVAEVGHFGTFQGIQLRGSF